MKGNKDLTDREKEILKQICSGLTNKQIGVKLDISYRTVDTHRTNIKKKLEAKHLVDLIRYALKKKIIK